ncbi:methylmalonyl-CoA mutase, partial [Lentzea sp. NPDC042327]
MMELAAEFPAASYGQWRDLVDAVLRKSGADFDSLITRTPDGIDVQPLYTDAPASFPCLAPVKQGWDIRQRHSVPDPIAVLNDLEGGVTSLWLSVPADSLKTVLADVHLDLTPIVLDGSPEVAVAMLRLWGRIAPESVRGTLALRPTGDALDLITRVSRTFPGLRTVVVDALPFHDAGGSDAEELGASLAL